MALAVDKQLVGSTSSVHHKAGGEYCDTEGEHVQGEQVRSLQDAEECKVTPDALFACGFDLNLSKPSYCQGRRPGRSIYPQSVTPDRIKSTNDMINIQKDKLDVVLP